MPVSTKMRAPSSVCASCSACRGCREGGGWCVYAYLLLFCSLSPSPSHSPMLPPSVSVSASVSLFCVSLSASPAPRLSLPAPPPLFLGAGVRVRGPVQRLQLLGAVAMRLEESLRHHRCVLLEESPLRRRHRAGATAAGGSSAAALGGGALLGVLRVHGAGGLVRQQPQPQQHRVGAARGVLWQSEQRQRVAALLGELGGEGARGREQQRRAPAVVGRDGRHEAPQRVKVLQHLHHAGGGSVAQRRLSGGSAMARR